MSELNLYLDLETTGLYPDQHTILAIGAVADTLQNNMVAFTCLIKPTEEQWKAASPEALAVNGLTWDSFEKALSLDEALRAFVSWLMAHDVMDSTYNYVGQNPKFDISFLRKHLGDRVMRFIGFPLSRVYDNRDVYSLLHKYGVIGGIERRSSERISKVLGLEPEPFPHNALAGALAAKQSFETMRSLVRENLPNAVIPYQNFYMLFT